MHNPNTRILSIALLVLMVPIFLHADNECSAEYSKYPEVREYSLRFKDKVETYGCGVVDLYAELVRADAMEETLDAIDDNPGLIPPLLKIFSNKKLQKLFRRNKVLERALLGNALSEKYLSNLDYLLSHNMNYAMERRVLQDSRYFNFYSLGAYYGDTPKEASRYYHMLRKRVSVDSLDMFAAIMDALRTKYRFEDVIDSIVTIKSRLNSAESAAH